MKIRVQAGLWKTWFCLMPLLVTANAGGARRHVPREHQKKRARRYHRGRFLVLAVRSSGNARNRLTAISAWMSFAVAGIGGPTDEQTEDQKEVPFHGRKTKDGEGAGGTRSCGRRCLHPVRRSSRGLRRFHSKRSGSLRRAGRTAALFPVPRLHRVRGKAMGRSNADREEEAGRQTEGFTLRTLDIDHDGEVYDRTYSRAPMPSMN